MDEFWVKWPAHRDVAAAYEIHIGTSGFETVLHVKESVGLEDALAALDGALSNTLSGLTSSGSNPVRVRNLEDSIACIHAEMANDGSVSVGWGSPTARERIGGRAEVRTLLLHARNDLAQRRAGRRAG